MYHPLTHLRTISNPNPHLRPTTEHCNAVRCNAATKSGKKFCTNHVAQHDYVKEIEKKIKAREAELKQVDANAELPEDSHLISEVRAMLWQDGRISAPGLSRYINVSSEQATALLRYAEKRGLCELKLSKRSPKKLVANALFPNGGNNLTLLGGLS